MIIPNIRENKRCSKAPTRNTVTVHKPTLTTAPTPSPTNTTQEPNIRSKSSSSIPFYPQEIDMAMDQNRDAPSK